MKTYLSTTPYTGAAASLMVILNNFDPSFELSRENEFDIWRESAPFPIRGCSIFGLALYAHKQGLDATVVVGNPEFCYPRYRFKRYKKIDVDIARFATEIMHRKCEKAGIAIEEHDFSLEDVKKRLAEDCILLLRLDAGYIRDGASVLDANYYTVWDYQDGHFIVMDPKEGEKKIPEAEVQTAFDAVTERCKRDHKMIVFGPENRKE